MTKNIIIAILAVLLLLSSVYGIVQRKEAEQQRALAASAEQRAIDAAAQAEMQRKLADANAAEAMKQRDLALQAAANSKNRK